MERNAVPGNSFAQTGQALPISKSIKVDLETPLESFFYGLTVFGFSGFFACCFLFFYSFGQTNGLDYPMLHGMVVCVGIGAMAIFLRRQTANYYIFQPTGKKVLYHFGLLGKERVSEFLDFSDILFIGVTGQFQQERQGKWWNYQMVLFTVTGRRIPLSDFLKEGRPNLNRRAQLLAEIAGCRWLECPAGGVLKMSSHPKEGFVFSCPVVANPAVKFAMDKIVAVLVGLGICLLIFLRLSR